MKLIHSEINVWRLPETLCEVDDTCMNLTESKKLHSATSYCFEGKCFCDGLRFSSGECFVRDPNRLILANLALFMALIVTLLAGVSSRNIDFSTSVLSSSLTLAGIIGFLSIAISLFLDGILLAGFFETGDGVLVVVALAESMAETTIYFQFMYLEMAWKNAMEMRFAGSRPHSTPAINVFKWQLRALLLAYGFSILLGTVFHVIEFREAHMGLLTIMFWCVLFVYRSVGKYFQAEYNVPGRASMEEQKGIFFRQTKTLVFVIVGSWICGILHEVLHREGIEKETVQSAMILLYSKFVYYGVLLLASYLITKYTSRNYSSRTKVIPSAQASFLRTNMSTTPSLESRLYKFKLTETRFKSRRHTSDVLDSLFPLEHRRLSSSSKNQRKRRASMMDFPPGSTRSGSSSSSMSSLGPLFPV